jgi:hypothetical protein
MNAPARANLRLLLLVVVILGLIGIFIHGTIDANRDVRRRDEALAMEAKTKAEALTVRDLPPGVRAAWEKYADKKFDEVVKVDKGNIRVDYGRGIAYISPDMPYQTTCPRPLIILAGFGIGDDSTDAYIIGRTSGFPGLDIKAADEPVLGVDRDSLAAKQLGADLCARVSSKLHNLVESSRERPPR